MSDTDKTRGGGSDERPMLILGGDQPDVEDTTPEQLRRQQEEARREIEAARQRAQEEIERRRREAEREIAELEEQTQRELEERERELDRTQRKLYQRESKLLRRQARTAGSAQRRLVQEPKGRPLRERGLRGSGWAILLGAVAVLGITLGAVVPGDHEPELAAEVSATEQARVLWLQSGLAADEAISLRMADRPVPQGPDAALPGTELADQAAALVPDSERYRDRNEERTEEMLAEGTSDVRALTLWSQVHDEAGYAVGSWDVDNLREEAADQGNGPVVVAAIGLAALLALLVLALASRAWVAASLLAAAAALGIATLAAVSSGSTGDVRRAAVEHETTGDVLDEVYDQLGRDLQSAYGISVSYYADRPEYWEDNPFYDIPMTPALETYAEARETVGEAEDDPARAQAAVGLVEAGRAAFEEQLPALEASREQLLLELEESAPRPLAVPLGLAGAALVVAGVLVSRGRREGT